MITLGSGFVALIVPAFVRVFKKYIPQRIRRIRVPRRIHPVRRHRHRRHRRIRRIYIWGIVLAGVVGVAQTVYALVNQAFDGRLSKA